MTRRCVYRRIYRMSVGHSEDLFAQRITTVRKRYRRHPSVHQQLTLRLLPRLNLIRCRQIDADWVARSHHYARLAWISSSLARELTLTRKKTSVGSERIESRYKFFFKFKFDIFNFDFHFSLFIQEEICTINYVNKNIKFHYYDVEGLWKLNCFKHSKHKLF